ncbi:MAG: hypothetical protein HYV63_02715 [Candidatus Schekmanbacteria bacterium]|nr:hypothetical protein [Candidatus Schekmanbacteria bacterium]
MEAIGLALLLGALCGIWFLLQRATGRLPADEQEGRAEERPAGCCGARLVCPGDDCPDKDREPGARLRPAQILAGHRLTTRRRMLLLFLAIAGATLLLWGAHLATAPVGSRSSGAGDSLSPAARDASN